MTTKRPTELNHVECVQNPIWMQVWLITTNDHQVNLGSLYGRERGGLG